MKALCEPKTKINFSKKRIKDIKEKFNESKYKFSKSKINEIGRNIYDIKNPKNLFTSKIKVISQIEKNLFKSKKYYDYDDTEYKGLRDVRILFNLSIDKDYHKPVKTVSGFDNNNYCSEYESKGGTDKVLSIIEYLNMIDHI